ncbi:hypothetical protein RsoM2USA_120 [Ralstonia phage RsoM2USA]|nr:hypothetical protein RsoM2USA_120 [Ralstonia phage RsoM2USA]
MATKQEALAQIEDKLVQIRILMQECEELANEHDVSFKLEAGPEGFEYNGRWGSWEDTEGYWMGSSC